MIEFSSLADLEKWIEEYQIQNNVKLGKRDACTLETIRKVYPEKWKLCKHELKYYSIHYSCMEGVKNFGGTGLRNLRRRKTDCPMKIRLILSQDGQSLRVAELHETHKHEINKNKSTNLAYPKVVQPSVPEQSRIKKTTDLTKKTEQSTDCFTNEMTVADLRNTIALLGVHDNFAHIAVDEGNAFLGIYYQSPSMKKCFAEYPEIVMLDASYKLADFDMTVYILMSVNGNNEGDPIVIFLVTEEKPDIIRHMLKNFKEENPLWSSTKYVLTDKYFSGISVVLDEFCEATSCLCIFHPLEHFRRDITMESMNIDSDQRAMCLKVLENIISSKNIILYEQFYKKLINLNLEKVTEYYNQNWHGVKEEWVEFLRNKKLIFGVNTHCHLESFVQKIKENSDEHNTIEGFFKNFLYLLSVNIEKRNQAAEAMIPKRQAITAQLSHNILYLKFLTLHAFKLLISHLEPISKFTVTSNDTYCDVTCNESPDETYKVDLTSYKCSCNFNELHQLPCEHIFAVKCYEKKELYDETLVHKRHLKSKYIKLYTSLNATECGNLTTQQKYNIARSKCRELARVLSKFDDSEFRDRCGVLDYLLQSWSNTNIPNKDTSENFGLGEEIGENKLDTDEHEQPCEIKTEQDMDYTVQYMESDSELNNIEEFIKNKNVVTVVDDEETAEITPNLKVKPSTQLKRCRKRNLKRLKKN